jgi:hypothetical protein
MCHKDTAVRIRHIMQCWSDSVVSETHGSARKVVWCPKHRVVSKRIKNTLLHENYAIISERHYFARKIVQK